LSPPERRTVNIELARPPSLAIRLPLLRLMCLPKASWRASTLLVWCSRLAVRPPRGLRKRQALPVLPGCDPSSGLHSASESCPHPRAPSRGPRRARWDECVRSHEVSRPHSATQPREPPLPGLPPPGPVASPHFLRASTPCSRHGLPGMSQPGALTGFDPSELDTAGIGVVSRRRVPSCDWQSGTLRGLERVQAWCGLPGPGCPPRPFGPGFDRLVVPGPSFRSFRGQFRIADAPARPARRPLARKSRPRFRGLLPLPVGASASKSLRRAAPWLSWVSSSLGPALPWPWTFRSSSQVLG